MIWFGWLDTDTRWGRAAVAACREALDVLLPRAWETLGGGVDDTLFASASGNVSGGLTGRAAGLSWERAAAFEAAEVRWSHGPPAVCPPAGSVPSGSSRGLRIDVTDAAGAPIGGLVLVGDAVYRRAEVRRGLAASIETFARRTGRCAVLASARRPLPLVRPSRPGDLSPATVVCRCDNPTCPSWGAEMLLRLQEPPWGQRTALDVVAHPCARCPGPWERRWPLAFVRVASPADLHGRSTIVFPLPPAQRRCTPVGGPLERVVESPSAGPWRVWTDEAVPRPGRWLRRFLATRRPTLLLRGLREEPAIAGPLSAGLLAPENLRSLVEMVRCMTPARRGGLAEGLSHAFCTRPPRSYLPAGDPVDETRFHYIAYDPEAFHRRLLAWGCLRRRGPFLDVGCGIGEKVFLAYAMGRFVRCDGLEYDPHTAAVAGFLLDRAAGSDPYPCRIVRGDALSFSGYADYAVIYMFRPLRDRGLMERLLDRITAAMRPRAIVCDVHREGLAIKKLPDGSLLAALPAGDAESVEWRPISTLATFLREGGLP